MFRNRISGFYQDGDPQEEPRAPVTSSGFVAVPVAQLPADVQQAIKLQQSLYQLAFAQAQARLD